MPYLLAQMRRTLPHVHTPTFDREGVLPMNLQRIFDLLGLQEKQMMWVENSGHAQEER